MPDILQTLAPSNSQRPLAALAREAGAVIVRIREAHGSLLRLIMSLGDTLIEARDQVSHGQWADWLHENCELSARTAQSYMQLARHRAPIQAKSADSADLSIDAALKYVRKIAGKTEVAVAAPVDEPSPEVLAQRAASAARIRGFLGDDLRDDHPDAGVDDDDLAAATLKRAEHTTVNGTAPATIEEITTTEKPEPVEASAGVLAGARKTVEILTESEEPESGPQSSGEVARLQARIDELENEVRQRDFKIAGLEKEVRHLLRVRKEKAADDELSDRLTAKFNAAMNKGSRVQRSDGFESIVNDIQKNECSIKIRATLPKADQSADQDPAPTEAPKVTTNTTVH